MGELELIDAFNFVEKIPIHIFQNSSMIRNLVYRNINEEALLSKNIPVWMMDINRDFNNLSFEEKYQALARFGYRLAKDILKHMDLGVLIAQKPLPPTYLPLPSISADSKAWHFIERTGGHIPFIYDFKMESGEVYAKISYEST